MGIATNLSQKINELLSIDEASQITFDGEMFPKFGQCIVMAGGAGSGKGYVIENHIAINADILDVDELKKTYIKIQKSKDIPDSQQEKKSTQLLNRIRTNNPIIANDDHNYDLKNSDDVSLLHQKVSKELNWKNRTYQKFYQAAKSANPERLPNIIFDITGKDLDQLKTVTEIPKELGYKITLVWVVTNREEAIIRNNSRDRTVSRQAFHDTHNGVNATLKQVLRNPILPKYYDSFWLVFNSGETIKPATPEEKIQRHNDAVVKLTKTTDGFIIKGRNNEETQNIRNKLYSTLGFINEYPVAENPNHWISNKDVRNLMVKKPMTDFRGFPVKNKKTNQQLTYNDIPDDLRKVTTFRKKQV